MSGSYATIELPRPGRDVPGGGAGRRAREELSVLGHRAVSVRSADQRRHHAVLAQGRLPVWLTTRSFYSEVRAGISVTGGMPLRKISPFARTLHQLRLRGDRHRVQRGPPRQRQRRQSRRSAVRLARSRPPHREPRQPDGRLQHRRQSVRRRAAGCASRARSKSPAGCLGGTTDYIRPDAEVDPLHSAHAPHRVRPARAGRAGSAPTAAPTAALLPPLLPRRRDADPRRRHPHGRPARLAAAGARRRQVRAVQRGVLLRHRQHGARARVPRRRARPTRKATRSTSARCARRAASRCA